MVEEILENIPNFLKHTNLFSGIRDAYYIIITIKINLNNEINFVFNDEISYVEGGNNF